jgi:NAD(P)-dependent dehydrogenase (short-subunit alcohol dehydrogenase family)
MPLNPRIPNWQGQVVWLVGASTGIGLAVAEQLHGHGARVVVSARKAEALQAWAQAHPGSLALPLDVGDVAALRAATQRIISEFGRIDLAGYFAGTYQPMRATAFDLSQALLHDDINYRGALHWLDALLPTLLSQGQGHLSLVSSVAGYRGLPQSLAYGPTKAALIHLAETLYLDLHERGLGVSLVNPGFVKTPLTAQNQFDMPALIEPEEAARQVVRGWERGDFEIHFPKRFTRWLKLLRLLGYRAYFPLVRRATGL